MGYHTIKIDKGILGEFSKIKEEFQEAEDGFYQNNPILVLCELADMLGAVESFVENNFNLSLEDVIKMKDLTKSAFKDGTRK